MKKRNSENINGTVKKRRKTLKIKPRFLIVLLLLAIIIISLCSNIFNNKTEAATKDIVDIVLFFGQSNMVGSEFPTEETRHSGREATFAKETDTDENIVNKISNCAVVNIEMPTSPTGPVAYEYLYYQPGSATARNAVREIKQTTTGGAYEQFPWVSAGLWVTGECLKWNGSGISKVTETLTDTNYDTTISFSMNMIPQFCKTYYETTGHKVLVVHCAKGGQGIAEFGPNGNIGKIMAEKFKAACDYANSRSDWTVGNKFFVSMQGENDVGGVHMNVQTKDGYKTSYRAVVDNLKSKCSITKGALVETGYEIPYYGSVEYPNGATMSDVNTIYQAQQELISGYNDTILGSDYGYNSFVPNTLEDYNQNCTTKVSYTNGIKVSWAEAFNKAYERMDCATTDGVPTNKIHYTAASLCQVGLETATNLANEILPVNLTLSSESKTIEYGSTTTFTISRTATAGTLGIESTNTNVATATLNGNTVTVTATGVGECNIWVGSQPTATYRGESKPFHITVTKATPTVSLSATSGSVTAGSTTTFTASVTSGAGALSVSSSNTNIATASISNGTVTVTGKAAGTATITVTSATNTNYNSASKTYSVTVTNPEKQNPTITLNPTSGSVNVGGTTTFTASVTSGAGALSVSSSNTNIATASISNGTVTVTGVAEGSATITVTSAANTSYNSASKTYSITVTATQKPTPTITLDDVYNTNGVVDTNHYVVLEGSKPSGSGAWTYSSSNPDIFVMLENQNTFKIGGYSGKTGTATITIGCEESSSYAAASVTYNVTITAVKPTPTITLNDEYNNNGVVDTNHYVVLEGSKPSGSGAWTYSSSNPDIFVVLENQNTFKIGGYSGKTGAAIITIGCEENSSYAAASTTYKVMVVKASGYSGTYDGTAHGISVECSGTTIKYGTTSGTYNLTTSPTFTDAGTHTVYYQISKSGYTTATGSQTVIIHKVEPTITLSKTSGEVTVGGTTTFTASVTSGAGALSVSSSATGKATASINNGTVTVTGVAE
ncbi:MAG: Ig domain-containing protein, partial [Clostridia bacterium]|nr:Ig domain-containing protein [Clostridia bacterium]